MKNRIEGYIRFDVLRFLAPLTKQVKGRDLFVVAMALWLLGCVALQNYFSTPYGVQCPTAPVQGIKVAVRNCCGRIVGERTEAPKPGSKFFVQCRCAEKGHAQQDSAAPSKLEPFTLSPFVLSLPGIPSKPRTRYAYFAKAARHSIPPSVRPPNLG